MFVKKSAAVGLVKIKLLQGMCGHRVKVVPAHEKTVKRENSAGELDDVLVKVPEQTVVTGEFVYEKGDITDWPAVEAARLQEKGIAEILQAAGA